MTKSIEKHLVIVNRLRSQIVSGKYQPDGKIPTMRELAYHYRASSATVNKALAVLTKEGFIRSRGRNGTFVVSRPPHLYQYAIVCSKDGISNYESVIQAAGFLPTRSQGTIQTASSPVTDVPE